MNQTVVLLMDILDKYFKIHDCGDGEIELETWTDGGVNMIIYVDKNNIIEGFLKEIEVFDIDESIELHRQEKSYCNDFTIKESFNDFEAYQSWLEDIAEELQGNTSKVSTEVMKRHISYIEALEEVISKWNHATDVDEKGRFIKAIGEIGYKIHKQNIALNI